MTFEDMTFELFDLIMGNTLALYSYLEIKKIVRRASF
jgi:hypothetical protein